MEIWRKMKKKKLKHKPGILQGGAERGILPPFPFPGGQGFECLWCSSEQAAVGEGSEGRVGWGVGMVLCTVGPAGGGTQGPD